LVCPEGQYLKGISSAGVKDCKDSFGGSYVENWVQIESWELKTTIGGVSIAGGGHWDIYQTGALRTDSASGVCSSANPKTNRCSCPSGYTAVKTGQDEKVGDGAVFSGCSSDDCDKLDIRVRYHVRYLCLPSS
jgi:hypothetical protein